MYSTNNTFLFYDSFASFTVPVSTGEAGFSVHFVHPVKVINPANNKSVSVSMLIDTGGQITRIYYPRLASLGIDLKSGGRGTSTTIYTGRTPVYDHTLKVQIGTLKPITIPVMLHTDKDLARTDTLGWGGVLNQLSLTISGRKLTYNEVVSALAMAFYSSFSTSSSKDYRSK